MDSFGKLCTLFILAVLIVCLCAWVFMVLWNACLIPAVTWANPIGFKTAAGLFVLFGFLGGRLISGSSK